MEEKCRIYGRFVENLWKISEKFKEDLCNIFERSQFKKYGSYVQNLWKLDGKNIKDMWKIDEEIRKIFGKFREKYIKEFEATWKIFSCF